ncbi:hypothetical protein [Paludisphaera rhizosphaerae]|uniref:hypothetical protein n=1 Tax=Paludisphaera rhizosphaerae TaxID=2711216 RepID=UPI0013EC782D|nr:hypothetical protein [Paludisphaera rhizosphaerae]
MIPAELTEAFRVLAQSADGLRSYCPRYEESILYRRVDEDGFYEDIPIPSKAVAITCASLIHEMFHRIEDDSVKKLAVEIQSLILMMLDLSSEYHWAIDKNVSLVQGPYDTSWAILQRLASCTLNAIGAQSGAPRIPFGDFLGFASFSRWEIVPASGDLHRLPRADGENDR